MTTGAFSRNVSKLISEFKLVAFMQEPTQKPLKVIALIKIPPPNLGSQCNMSSDLNNTPSDWMDGWQEEFTNRVFGVGTLFDPLTLLQMVTSVWC